jgi:hypothetical protein
MKRWPLMLATLLTMGCLGGCRSPYAQDRLALAGAGVGGVAGAAIGAATGHTAQGALIGAAVGTAAGAITGSAIDESEARNRAAIEYHMRRPVAAGAVSVEDVIAMVHSGVPEPIIVSHVNTRGMSHAVNTPELIRMQQAGVPPAVMAATQRPPRVAPTTVVVEQPPPPTTVIVERRGCYHPYYRHYHRGPSASFGVSYHNW